MSWKDFISYILATSSKVEKIAVFDKMGRPIAISADTEVSQSEGQALINCLHDPSKTMTKLHIDNDDFLCIQGIDKTFIGTSIRNSQRVVVAKQDGDEVIVVLGMATASGSFIFVLKQTLLLRAEGKLRPGQQQQCLPEGSNIVEAEVAVSSEQVLVDLA